MKKPYPPKPPAKRSKYRNVKVTMSGITFDSKKEAARYLCLKDDEKRGLVINIAVHVRIPLKVNGTHVCDYEADFVYERKRSDGSWEHVVEDVKGFKTDVYKLKKKLVAALGITIHET